MSDDPKIIQLRETKTQGRYGGGEERIKAQHERGRLTARERIDLLLRLYNHICKTGQKRDNADQNDNNRHQENIAQPPKPTRPGWFSFVLSAENHPGLAISGCFASFS